MARRMLVLENLKTRPGDEAEKAEALEIVDRLLAAQQQQ
jgi:hypothetical protein